MGKTKKGKGTKVMLLTDGQGIPISAFTTSAQDAEVNTIETLIDVRVTKKRPRRLLYDKAVDADWLRDALERRGIEQITPHATVDEKLLARMAVRFVDIAIAGKLNAPSVGCNISEDSLYATNDTPICSKDLYISRAS